MPDLVKTAGSSSLARCKQAQRVVVARAWADLPVERRHGLEIVVEHVRPRRHHHVERAVLAQEVRRQHLDGRRRRLPIDGSNSRREMRSTSVGKIVAVDRRHHHMGEREIGDGPPNPRGLERIERAGTAGAHVAEGASPGAGVAEDHHGRVPLAPALADIRAGSLLAHGVEAVLAQGRARFVKGMRPRRPDADPVGLPQDGRIGQPRLLRMARPRLVLSGGCYRHVSGNAGANKTAP